MGEFFLENRGSLSDDEAHGGYAGSASSGNDTAQIDDLFERDR